MAEQSPNVGGIVYGLTLPDLTPTLTGHPIKLLPLTGQIAPSPVFNLYHPMLRVNGPQYG